MLNLVCVSMPYRERINATRVVKVERMLIYFFEGREKYLCDTISNKRISLINYVHLLVELHGCVDICKSKLTVGCVVSSASLGLLESLVCKPGSLREVHYILFNKLFK